VSAPVEAEGLVRTFGEVHAVNGIDLRVAEGEIFGFLGPNGAGKSTTIRMLVTLLRPTDGVARVAGFDVVREADKVRRAIGVALQDAAIDPLMTGNELLRLQATLHGIPKGEARQRTGELLERVGLTAAADRKVGGYSGGMRRRLDLAMSLVHRPSVLFLDEPTTGLDPSSRHNLWEEVRTLNDDGTTVFLTTQYLEEADALAERIAIIDHGDIVKEGAPAALKAQVGAPTLVLEIDGDHLEAARTHLCSRFGSERPAKPGWLAIGLEGGASEMTSVVRALDEIGAVVEHIELNAPSLDDVFAEATGRRLEGAEEAAAGTDGGPPLESDSPMETLAGELGT
jgi:ABC-2 type transport system ATP-binding protein